MRKTPISLALVYLCVAVVLLLFAGMLIRMSETTTAIRDTQKEVRSCTTPGEKCFDDAQKRTAAVVGDINRISILAAACADLPGRQTAQEIEICVRVRLAQAADRSGR